MRASAVVNCHRTSTIRSFRYSSQAVTSLSNSSLVSIRRSRHELSVKQRVVLQEIFDKVCGADQDDVS